MDDAVVSSLHCSQWINLPLSFSFNSSISCAIYYMLKACYRVLKIPHKVTSSGRTDNMFILYCVLFVLFLLFMYCNETVHYSLILKRSYTHTHFIQNLPILPFSESDFAHCLNCFCQVPLLNFRNLSNKPRIPQ